MTVAVTPIGDRAHRRLHAEILKRLRPEFAVDVLIPAVGDPIIGTPACMVAQCGRYLHQRLLRSASRPVDPRWPPRP